MKKRLHFLFCVLLWICFFNGSSAYSQEIVDSWRYTLSQPEEHWNQTDFKDTSWKHAKGGFGTHSTPNSRVGTVWNSNEIWLRKTFEIDKIPAKPALLVHHDEDASVFLNGELLTKLNGYSTKYQLVVIPKEKSSIIKAGTNLMAVQCRQTTGGQFIDVHLVDADNVPQLPVPRQETTPFQSKLITTWGQRVTPDNAWTEYPRPMMRRSRWTSLNGRWNYVVTTKQRTIMPENWGGEILVPFCLESKLGGVRRLLLPDEALWYQRVFEAKPVRGKRTMLNFEAVDYRCEVFVNRQSVGKHTGGNTPFSIDITHALATGPNELVVRVEDDTEAFQLRGKQSLNPRGIWYTQVSGIWQSVWLEEVSNDHFVDLKIQTSADDGSIRIRPIIEGHGEFKVTIKESGEIVAQASGADTISFQVPNAKLWSPVSPHLYQLDVELLDATGNTVDLVRSYAGIRSIGKARDADGHWRFTLNGKPIFHWGTLDQGWWPDGLLTPPSDEAMRFDIEWLKAAGFNMIRKHIKLEPRRYYYHCDRIGMLVWQDQVSGGQKNQGHWPNWTRLKPNPKDAVWPEDQREQFMYEFEEMVSTLENHPSIACWVPFNEAWGQHQTIQTGQWIAKRDPTRLVNIASGGNFWSTGDIVDAHKYPHPEFPFDQNESDRFDDYIKVMGEFGGHGFPATNHLWDSSRRNWGYGGLPKNASEYKKRYQTSIEMLNNLRLKGIAGGVYTQTTDVEGEINGLMSYDRKVIKIPANQLAEFHSILYQENDSKSPNQAPRTEANQLSLPTVDKRSIDRKPGPVMDAETIRAGLESHDRALYIKAGWIRDPYITLGPDGYYYLTGTQPNENDPREKEDPYNTGLGIESIVGTQVRVYRSKDLIQWESLGVPYSIEDSLFAQTKSKKPKRIWAPELHWLGDRWALVHCPKRVSSLALTKGEKLEGPWSHPMGTDLGQRHDPSLFTDMGTTFLLWQNTLIAPLSEDLTKYTSDPIRIDPSSTRPGPEGQPITRIGHEGATMMKVGDQYVHLGTAWSTDQGRKGSYNLYYCTADRITGPYGPRKFAGRFLGHGTPFQTRNGDWWCTAFFNANVPPLPRVGIQTRDIGNNAQTINEQGVTIVPLDVRILENGEVFIRAKDPDYANPGPDEAQKFTLHDK